MHCRCDWNCKLTAMPAYGRITPSNHDTFLNRAILKPVLMPPVPLVMIVCNNKLKAASYLIHLLTAHLRNAFDGSNAALIQAKLSSAIRLRRGSCSRLFVAQVIRILPLLPQPHQRERHSHAFCRSVLVAYSHLGTCRWEDLRASRQFLVSERFAISERRHDV